MTASVSSVARHWLWALSAKRMNVSVASKLLKYPPPPRYPCQLMKHGIERLGLGEEHLLRTPEFSPKNCFNLLT